MDYEDINKQLDLMDETVNKISSSHHQRTYFEITPLN